MQTSVHITYYVLHLDVLSSNKSCSSSVILLLLFHKHIQRNTIPQWHSLVADTTLRWSVHLCIFRTLINLAVVCGSAVCSVTDMQLLTERSHCFDYELDNILLQICKASHRISCLFGRDIRGLTLVTMSAEVVYQEVMYPTVKWVNVNSKLNHVVVLERKLCSDDSHKDQFCRLLFLEDSLHEQIV